jgi:cysteine synthase
VDEVWAIDDGEAIEMTARLAQEEGIFAGVSSGANVVGARRLAASGEGCGRRHAGCG